MFIQATVAILILVGFESVTSMGGEAKNPTKHIPIAVIASLLIQGLVCYLFEYFCANYFLNSGYTMQSAARLRRAHRRHDDHRRRWLLGQGHGKYFMLAEAITVFLALIGTTLSCMNTGARVTYAMGKDDEAPEHFGMLHAKSLSPARAIWTLAVISAVIGVIAVSLVFGDASAPTDAPSPRCRTASSPASAIPRTTRWPRCPTRCWPSRSPPTSAPSSSTR
jgi:basic amino acid/polyamine antiporter, APA family